MVIRFEAYAPMSLFTGDHVLLRGVKWDCVSPCTIVGLTERSNQPVLQGPDGPKLNDDELVPEGTLRTPGKKGQVPIEVMTFGQFVQISPTSLKGQEIATIGFNPWRLIITTEDQEYVKLVPVTDNDGGVRIEQEDITMRDLQTLGYINSEVYETYETQLKAAHKTDAERHGEQQLKQAIVALGSKRVLEVINRVVAEDLQNLGFSRMKMRPGLGPQTTTPATQEKPYPQ